MPSRADITTAFAGLAFIGLCLQVELTPPPPPPAPPAPAEAPAPPPPEPTPEQQAAALPPLPEVAVGGHEIHMIPPDTSPLRNADGSERHVGQSDEVRFGPAAAPLPAWRPAQGSGAGAAPNQFDGRAQVTGASGLQVGGIRVQLFGIKPPAPGERCGEGSADCASVAVAALERRIAVAGNVSCRVPAPHPGSGTVTAICQDPIGVDLSGFLIGEGLATADTGQSYDYVGAENVARNLKRGFWKFR